MSSAYLKENKEETKLKYAINKVRARTTKCFQQYYEQKEDIEIDLANVDEKGSVLFTVNAKGVREYQFTKEGVKELNKQLKELFTEDRFEIESHICNELPEDIQGEYLNYFDGFVCINNKSEE